MVVGEGFQGRVAVETHISGVPELLRQIDPDLKVFYNMRDHVYEVWGFDARGPYMLGAWNTLGQHVVEAVRKGYWLARNTGKPWNKFLQELRRRREEDDLQEAKFLNDLDLALQDDFRWFGRTLYPGWSR